LKKGGTPKNIKSLFPGVGMPQLDKWLEGFLALLLPSIQFIDERQNLLHEGNWNPNRFCFIPIS